MLVIVVAMACVTRLRGCAARPMDVGDPPACIGFLKCQRLHEPIANIFLPKASRDEGFRDDHGQPILIDDVTFYSLRGRRSDIGHVGNHVMGGIFLEGSLGCASFSDDDGRQEKSFERRRVFSPERIADQVRDLRRAGCCHVFPGEVFRRSIMTCVSIWVGFRRDFRPVIMIVTIVMTLSSDDGELLDP